MEKLITINSEIPLRALSELSGLCFHIPYQQRGYKWTSSNVRALLSDLYDFIKSGDGKRIYCLQPIAVTKKSDRDFVVLDGQQRLTTLLLLHKYLFKDVPYQFCYERDMGTDSKDNRWGFLTELPSVNCVERADQNIDFFFINNAYQTIASCFSVEAAEENNIFRVNDESELATIIDEFKKLLLRPASEKSVQVIWYLVPEEKQHEQFRNLNSGKISLSNSELIKALLLNRVSGLPTGMREEAAAQFEQIERALKNDSFWYMLRCEEANGKQVRMDLLFNLVSGTRQEDYERDSRLSFEWFSKAETGSLDEKWQKIRHTFYRLWDLYNDTTTFHYIGFLTYCNKSSHSYKMLNDLLKEHRAKNKKDFIEHLRKEIRKKLKGDSRCLDDYSYDSKKSELRQLFLLHNIETIISKYTLLHSNNELELQHEYERFPFDLLNKQNWDIEHIASQTDSKMNNADDRNDWYDSMTSEYAEYFSGKEYSTLSEIDKIQDIKNERHLAYIKFYQNKYLKSKKEEDFQDLYKAVILFHESKEPDSIPEEQKNRIGNLVLLDSHTNRGYHNALFPKKRRYVIISDGLKSQNDIEKLKTLFIPICTRQCFTKSYSKTSNTKLNAWLLSDAIAYENDIEAKLCDSKDGKIKRFLKIRD